MSNHMGAPQEEEFHFYSGKAKVGKDNHVFRRLDLQAFVETKPELGKPEFLFPEMLIEKKPVPQPDEQPAEKHTAIPTQAKYNGQGKANDSVCDCGCKKPETRDRHNSWIKRAKESLLSQR